MSEQSTSGPQTGMDRFFATLRRIDIRRRTDDKWIAGVCSGLADRLGIDPVILRAGLILLSLLGGAGITIYLVAWALLPNDRDEIGTPTTVTAGADNHHYRLGVGNGVLDLSGLPTEGLSGVAIPASVGMGELKVLVPPGLTVKVVGHVGLGEILLPQDRGNTGQGGSDVSRSVVIGDGPAEVVVNAGVGIGQLTVVKE
jgi:Putative stress-responsive transcriptional regulator